MVPKLDRTFGTQERKVGKPNIFVKYLGTKFSMYRPVYGRVQEYKKLYLHVLYQYTPVPTVFSIPKTGSSSIASHR